jgi:sugar phosphate isomerase/epimerase
MPNYSIGSQLYMADDTGEFVGDPVEALRAVAASGYSEVELMAEGVGWEEGAPDPAPYREALESSGLYPHTIHAPFRSINLASFDEAERKESVAQVAAAMRFHAEVGGRTIVVHPSGSPTSPDEPLYTKENVGAATESAHRSISELVRVGEETGVRMALENLVAKVGFAARPLETMQELRSFMADLPAEYVGICHDIGHTRLRKLDVASETRIASERLYALHIQDGSSDEDDHLPPGHGVIDFDSFGQALTDIGFDGAWTLEVLATNHPGTVEDVAIELAAIRDRWVAEGIRNAKSLSDNPK